MLAIVALFLSLLNRKGAFQAFEWETTQKQSAKSQREDGAVTLSKVTTATVRTGVEYKNLAANVDRETGALPWGEWYIYPFVITHKGNLYGRIYAKRDTVKSVYFVNGEKVDRAEWLSYQIPSAGKPRKDAGETLTLTPRLDSLKAL